MEDVTELARMHVQEVVVIIVMQVVILLAVLIAQVFLDIDYG